MTAQESVHEAARLRLRMHMNSRLRLETLAALSKVFREHGEPIRDELLGSLVFAVPQELLGEAQPGNGEARALAEPGRPSVPPPGQEPGRPSVPPPGREPGRPSVPPPGREPGRPSVPPPVRDVGKPSVPPPGR